jgi:hypothetical protein
MYSLLKVGHEFHEFTRKGMSFNSTNSHETNKISEI